MIHKYLKFIGISLLLLAFLTGTANITFAAVNMDELKEKFKKETGQEWSKVSSQERRDFMYKIRGREKKEERQRRVEGVKIPFYIREGYKRDKNMKWEDATEEEQEQYIQEYKELKKEREQEEKEQLLEEKRRLEEIEREKREKKAELKRKKQEKEREEKEKRRKEEEKRKEEKRKLEDSKRDRNEMLKKLKEMRERRNRVLHPR